MRNKEKILYIVTPLAETSLICIGFASWNSGSNNGTEASISVDTGNIKDNSLKFTSTAIVSPNITFDAYNIDKSGKVYSSDDSNENLELIIDGKINGYFKTWDLIRINLRIDPTYFVVYNELISLGYIQEPVFTDLLKSDNSVVSDLSTIGSYWKETINDSDNTRSFRFRYNFSYGKYFNYQNPSLFFDSKDFNGEKTGDSYSFDEKKKILSKFQSISGANFSAYLDIVDTTKTKKITFNSNGGSFSSLSTDTKIEKSELILHDKLKFPICYKTNCNFLGRNYNGKLYEGNKYYYIDDVFTDTSLSEISFTAAYEDLTSSGTLSFITGELYALANVKVVVYSNKNGSSEFNFTDSQGGTLTSVLKGDRIRIIPMSNVRSISYEGLSNKTIDEWQIVISNTFSITITPMDLCKAVINYSCSGTKLNESYFAYYIEVKNSNKEKISAYLTEKNLSKGVYLRINNIHGVASFSIDGLSPDSEGFYYINQSSININIVCSPSYNLTFNRSGGRATPTVNFKIENSDGYLYSKNDQAMGTINNCITKGDTVTITGGTEVSSNDGPKVVDSANITMNVVASNCLTENSLVMLANGDYKKAIDIRAGDLLMTINHENGHFEAAPVVFNDDYNKEADDYNVITLEFSNGKTVEVVYEHGFFDLDTMKYEYIKESNYKSFIGHKFVTVEQTATGLEKGEATLIRASLSNKHLRICSPVTYKNLDIVTDGMLSMPGGITGIFNIFDYDSDLSYNAEKKQQDIEKYGLFDYSHFEDRIPYEFYEAFNGQYLKVAIGKGMLTEEMIDHYIDIYLPISNDQNSGT